MHVTMSYDVTTREVSCMRDALANIQIKGFAVFMEFFEDWASALAKVNEARQTQGAGLNLTVTDGPEPVIIELEPVEVMCLQDALSCIHDPNYRVHPNFFAPWRRAADKFLAVSEEPAEVDEGDGEE